MKTLLLRALAAAGLCAGVLQAPGAAARDLLPYESSEAFFPSEDGTMLHADVFRPTGLGPDDKTPVILVVTPYRVFSSLTGRPQPPYAELERVFERGYSVVTASLRGYGESEGCGDFGGHGEQADAKAAVEWSASQPWSTGKVGMWGLSYDGWTQIMALAKKADGLAAAVVSSPLISLYRGLYMNGVHYDTAWHTTPAAYAAIDLASIGKPTPRDPQCYADNQTDTTNDNPRAPYWRERDLIRRASQSEVPVLFAHGFLDANTKPDNFLPVYGNLDGPKRAWYGQFVHRLASDRAVGRDGFLDESLAWFDRYLKGMPAAPILRSDYAVTVQQDDGKWRGEKQWPPRDATHHALRLNDGDYRDMPGNDASQGDASGQGVWSFTQKLPYDVHLAGPPKISLRVEAERPGAHVIVLVYDVERGGSASLITRGAFKLRGEALAPVKTRVAFELYPQDWRVERGHRIGVLVSGSDDSWFDPGTTGARVQLSQGSLSAPFLRFERDEFLKGVQSQDVGWARPGTSIEASKIAAHEIEVQLPPRMKKRR